jgi:uncharacterized membrane protein YkgB
MQLVRYGLAGVIAVHGAEKFSDYEVNNIKPLLESPVLSWLSRRIGLQRTARVVAVAELTIVTLLTVPPRRSRFSALGSALAMGMFATTLSFLFVTPAARTRTTKGIPILSDVGQFLIKDVVLMGASVLTLGEALHERAVHGH